jgi:dienelactone hydrolase
MIRLARIRPLLPFLALLPVGLSARSVPATEIAARLPGTHPLTEMGDLSVLMRAGIERYLRRETARSIETRKAFWHCDGSAREAYELSVEPNRARLRRYVGAVDERLSVTALEYVASTARPLDLAVTPTYTVRAVRWPVLEGVEGEGLLLEPRRPPIARVVALPDADQTPEMLAGQTTGVVPAAQFARRLAEQGCQVIVPVLIDRRDTWSGDPAIWRTNEPHREWVYRPAYEMGRHIIGYEVQKVLAVVDWFTRDKSPPLPIGVAGYGEGGLIALYSAGLDRRIDTVLVSGYFDSRQHVADEPIYRNVFGLLHEFGDAEIASLITPRTLVIEHSPTPQVDGPPPARDGRRPYAAPGRLRTPEFASVRAEVERAKALCPAGGMKQPAITLIAGASGATVGPGSDAALRAFLRSAERLPESGSAAAEAAVLRNVTYQQERQHRQVNQLVEHTQLLLRRSEAVRRQFWHKAQPTSPAAWHAACVEYRAYLRDEIIGRFPPPSVPANARARKAFERPTWIGYEVVLDVWPDVFLWGYLLVPRDLHPGERRPVVVCQHGLEGLPSDVITDDPKSPAFALYHAFAARLAEQGFVTFAPHNFYRGNNDFRQLQRLANPLKKTLFAITVGQHERLLDWLSSLPFVDPNRMGFYGLSYGGSSAVRVPALVERYALSISSADFNDWIRKSASVHDQYSLPFYNTYEAHEFNLGNTFSHAELVGLIAPRPFMVERGHKDSVAPDEWVAAEYAKVRRLYVQLGIPERTAIEFFDGPHAIHGVGTFAFLHEHLHWPPRGPR